MGLLNKKLLQVFSIFGVTTLVTSSVVSCGTGFDSLMNRVVSTDTFRKSFNYNMESWNTSQTMQATDHFVLSNTNANLLASDQYGRLYGDLVESNFGGKGKPGKPNSNNSQWTFKFRKDMYWIDSKGNKHDLIKPSDIKNTAMHALNAHNGSDIVPLWNDFLNGAQKVYDESKKIENITISDMEKLVDNYIITDDPNKLNEKGLYFNEEQNSVTFGLVKSVPYFESLLTYSVYSPIHRSIVGVQKPRYTNNYYSGAYYSSAEKANSKIILTKNKHYQFASETHIRNIEYYYSAGNAASRDRNLFESGDMSEFKILPTDSKGFKKYIGDDIENPNFEGVITDPKNPEKLSSMSIWYNYYHTDASKNNKDSKDAIISNKMLQSKEVRQFISTSLDRNEAARFYSKRFDTTKVSQTLRNTYSGVGMEANGKEYTEMISDIHNGLVNSNSGSYDQLKDGRDPLYNHANDYGKSQEQLITEIRDYMKSIGINDSRVTLTLALDPGNNNGLNPYINLMLNKFNAIENNPIKIVAKYSPDSASYRQLLISGAYSFAISGWIPDFNDPSSFLETLTLDGSMARYSGWNRLFLSKKPENSDNYVQVGTDDKARWVSKESYVENKTKEVHKEIQIFTDEFQAADRELVTNTEERFQKFAELEYSYVYKNFFVLPIYTKAVPKSYIVTYQNPFEKSYEAFGTSQYRFNGTKMNSKLLTKEEIQKREAEYWEMYKKIKNDPTEGMDKIWWQK